MSPSVKNIIVTLVAFTVAFAGYYLYVQNKSSALSLSGSDEVSAEMLANAQAFIGHSVILSQISLDTEIFSDPLFRSYRSFTSPVVPVPQGRPNPFEEIGVEPTE